MNQNNPQTLDGIFAQAVDLSARFHRVTVQTKFPRTTKTIKGLVADIEAQHGATIGKALKETGSRLYDETHPFWAGIKKARSAVVAMHTKMTSVWDGTQWRLLSTANWAEYGQKINPLISAFNRIADDGPMLFPEFLLDAQNRLGSLFNRDDYPDDATEFRRAFEIIPRQEPIPKLDDTQRLSTVLPVAEIEDMKQAMERAYADNIARISVQNWEMMHERAARLQQSLIAFSKGEQRTVHQTLLDELEKCCQYCGQFNVNNDTRMSAMIEDIRNSITNLDMETIRTDSATRTTVIAAAASARDQAMAQMRKMRGITGSVTIN